MKKMDFSSLPPQLREIWETLESLAGSLEKMNFAVMAQTSLIEALIRNAPPKAALDAAKELEEQAAAAQNAEYKEFALELSKKYKNISENL